MELNVIYVKNLFGIFWPWDLLLLPPQQDHASASPELDTVMSPQGQAVRHWQGVGGEQHFPRVAEDGCLDVTGSPDLSLQLLSGRCSGQEQCLHSSTTSHQGLFAVLPRLTWRLSVNSSQGRLNIWYLITKSHRWQCDSLCSIFLTEP